MMNATIGMTITITIPKALGNIDVVGVPGTGLKLSLKVDMKGI